MTPPKRKRVSTTAKRVKFLGWVPVDRDGCFYFYDICNLKSDAADRATIRDCRVARISITEIPPKKRAKGKGK